MAVRDVKELTVYIKSYRVAMEFFEISKRFPPEERYALRHPKGADLPDLSAIICAKHGKTTIRSPFCQQAFRLYRGELGNGHGTRFCARLRIHQPGGARRAHIAEFRGRQDAGSMHEHPEKFLTPNA